ncbi:MAG: S41 family peptidase [Anaerovoracaceae bacterium]|jgi:carboxyl-terminal processing protease
MVIRKRNLLIFTIIVALIGALIGVGFFYLWGKVTGQVMVSGKDYDEYRRIKKDYSTLAELQKTIEDNYYIPVDREALFQGMYKGLFHGIGDPYSAYLNKKEYEELMISTSGEYQGIGVTVEPEESGYINVVAPIEGTPADKAGILPRDKIIGVDGEAFDASTIDMAVQRMRGKPGTSVKIRVLRGVRELDFQLIRASIILETVKTEMLGNNIGYIRITSFEEHTAENFKKAIKSLETDGAQGLIIDLRDNPGGLVDSSVEIADFLLPEGIITYTEDRHGRKVYYRSDAEHLKMPYVVLVNGNSASASEILAGAIKDNEGGSSHRNLHLWKGNNSIYSST